MSIIIRIVEYLVVIVDRPAILWTLHGNVLAIQSTKGMEELPSGSKLLSNPLPFFRCCGTGNYFLSKLFNDCFTYITDDQGDGVVSYSEAILHQGMVVVSCSQVPEGYGQLQTRFKCLSVPGVLFGDSVTQPDKQLMEHCWFYYHKILEGR